MCPAVLKTAVTWTERVVANKFKMVIDISYTKHKDEEDDGDVEKKRRPMEVLAGGTGEDVGWVLVDNLFELLPTRVHNMRKEKRETRRQHGLAMALYMKTRQRHPDDLPTLAEEVHKLQESDSSLLGLREGLDSSSGKEFYTDGGCHEGKRRWQQWTR